MKRFQVLLMLLICCLVMTACNYPVSHGTEVSDVPGEGILHIDYEVSEEQQKAFNSAASYQLHDNDAKLYIYREGTYDVSAELGMGSVATLEAKDTLSFRHTGESSYRLSIRYSGLEDGNYEIHWDCQFASTNNNAFFFKVLDADGNALTYDAEAFKSISEFYSYDYYQNAPDEPQKNIVFSVDSSAAAPTQTPSATPTATQTPSATPTATQMPSATPAPAGTPIPTPNANPALPPKTGDSATPLLWACLLVLGAVGFVSVCRQKAQG